MELYAMKTTMSSLVLEVLLVHALLLLLLSPGATCQGSKGGGGANLTVTGTVFCDACSSSSFSNHSYFLPGMVALVLVGACPYANTYYADVLVIMRA
jgi:hypothetical protein